MQASDGSQTLGSGILHSAVVLAALLHYGKLERSQVSQATCRQWNSITGNYSSVQLLITERLHAGVCVCVFEYSIHTLSFSHGQGHLAHKSGGSWIQDNRQLAECRLEMVFF